MNNNVGIWIDHRKAVIVNVMEHGEEVHSIVSGVEKHTRYSGGQAEDKKDRRFANHLKEYYDTVIGHLHDGDSLLIFGPGEAKKELQARIEVEVHGKHVVGLETEDKMTDPEIVAKVREHFAA